MNPLKSKSMHAAALGGLLAGDFLGRFTFNLADLLPPLKTRKLPRGNIGPKARAKRKAARASRRFNLRRSA